MKKKSGISLIVLVVTIIVMIIIAATIVILLTNSDTIDSAEEAKFKANMSGCRESYNLKLSDAMAANMSLDKSSINADKDYGDISEWIPGIEEEYVAKLYIDAGVLKVDGSALTVQEQAWAEQIGMKITDSSPVYANSNDWMCENGIITSFRGTITEGQDLVIPNRVIDSNTGIIQRVTTVGNGTESVFSYLTYNRKRIKKLIVSSGLAIANGGVSSSLGDTRYGIFPEEIIIGDDTVIDSTSIAFDNTCKKLVIGDDVICNQSFSTQKADASIEYIIMGNNVTYGDISFFYKLKKLTIGNNATISTLSFGNYIGSSEQPAVIEIGKNLNSKGVYVEGHGDLRCNRESYIASLTIGSIKTAANYSFSKIPLLKKVIIEDGATIGKGAFKDCTELEEVILENGNIAQSTDPFAGCTAIRKVTVDTKDASNIKEYNLFKDKTSITELDINDNATITITMFQNCTGITSISLANNNEVRTRAFENCTGLSTINFGHNAKIRAGVFKGCTALTEIIIPADVDLSKANVAFMGCTGLTKAVISDGITVLGPELFTDCSNLDDITLPSNLTTLNHVYNRCTGITNVVVPLGITSLTQDFQSCTKLEYVYIPSTITSMDRFAFNSNSTNLIQIRINKPRAEVEALTGYSKAFGLVLEHINKIICNDDPGWNSDWDNLWTPT